ncbi:hypothetical protein R3O67_28440 [Bacillus cereus]|uniref:hypothetical protein n=1 Tax=Bacillus cereus TaxID=1396 RepID=UPI0030792BA0
MSPRGTLSFAIISYISSLMLYFVSQENTLFYVMLLFLYINVATIFHPLVFHYGVMKPIEIGLSSVGLLSLFTGEFSSFVFILMFVVTLIFIEKEDMYSIIEVPNKKRNTLGLTIKRMIATIFMPFSVTYVVMIIRPYEEITSLLIVLLYFAALFVASKWFDSIISFGIFTLVQIFLFVYVIETYINWNSTQITMFFVSIFLFLVIGYGRKGLLNYVNNNKK